MRRAHYSLLFFLLLAPNFPTASAQVAGIQCTATATVPPLLRTEGVTELTGDVVLLCTGGVAGTPVTANLSVFLNTAIMNRITDSGTSAMDALLLVDEPLTPVLGVNMYQAVLSGNSATFANVSFTAPGAATRLFRITNIRAMAYFSTLSFGTGIGEVMCWLSFSGATPITINNPQQTIGFSQPSITTSLRTASDGAATVFNYQQCHGQNAALAANPAAAGGVVSFNVKFSELFPSAWKLKGSGQNSVGTIYNTESGYEPASNPSWGAADSGTRLVARFDNLPPGVVLYATVVPSPAGTSSSLLNNVVMTAADAYGGGAFSPVTPTSSVTINSTSVGIAPLAYMNGSWMATWEVRNSSLFASESASFGIVVAYPDNIPSPGLAQVRLSLGPVTTEMAASTTAPVPRFFDLVTRAVDAFSVQPCTPCNSLITPYIIRDLYPGGSAGTDVTVTATAACAWSAVSNSPWLSISQGSSGSGNGTVRFTASANSLNSPRAGSITIAGQTLSIMERAPYLIVSNQGNGSQEGYVSPGEAIFVSAPDLGATYGTSFTGPAAPFTPPLPSSPTTLGGVRLLFDGTPAPLQYTGRYGINAIVPYGVAGRVNTVIEAEYLGVKQDMATLPVAAVTPSLFPGPIFNQDLTLNSYNPALPGSVVSVFLNGAGQTNPAGTDGKYYLSTDTRPAPVQSITATVGGLPAEVVSKAMAAVDTATGYMNLLPAAVEVKVRVPVTAPAGSLPVTLTVGGIQTQSGPAINVAACTVSLSQYTQLASVFSGSYSVDVMPQNGCSWTASSDVNWIVITGGSSGTGNGTVTYTVSANNGTLQRGGNITIGGQTLSVIQAGATTPPCLTPASPTVWFESVDYISASNPSSDRLVVGRMPMTRFTGLSTVPLPSSLNQRFCGTIPIAPGYLAEAYVPTASERLGDFSAFSGLLLDPLASMTPFPGGMIPASRLPYTMAWRISTYGTCTVSVGLAGDSSTVPRSGGGRSLTVTASNSTCGWAATSNASWITFPAGNTGVGNATVSYTVAQNTTASVRTATITVAGQTFTVTQQAGVRLTFYDNVGATVNGWILSAGTAQTNGFAFTSILTGTTTSLSVAVASYTSPYYSGPIDSTHQITFTLVNNQSGQPGTVVYGTATVVPATFSPTYSVVSVPFSANLVAGTTYWLLATANAEGTLWGMAGGCTGQVGTCPGTYTGTRAVRAGGALSGGAWNLNQTDVPKGAFRLTADTSGQSKIGVVRSGAWYLDTNGNGVLEAGIDSNFNWWGGAGSVLVTGDWNGNGKTKAGFYKDGLWYLDYDGNGSFDGGATDKVYGFGWADPNVVPIVGDWTGDGKAKIGIYYKAQGLWFLDMNGNGVWDGPAVDRMFSWWGGAGSTPMIGDWNGDGRDKAGFYLNGLWYLDYNGNGVWEPGTDKLYGFGWSTPDVVPMVGDWSGTGKASVGLYYKPQGLWFLDMNGNGVWEPGTDRMFSWWGGTLTSTPVIGDWNGDGRAKAGFYLNGFWYVDVNGSGAWEAGTDAFYSFGQAGDTPVAGRW